MIDILMHSIKIYNTIGKESIITKTKDLNIHIKKLIDKYDENIKFNILNVMKNNNFLEIKIHKKENGKYNLLIKIHFNKFNEINKNKEFECFTDITYEKILNIINSRILIYSYKLFL